MLSIMAVMAIYYLLAIRNDIGLVLSKKSDYMKNCTILYNSIGFINI